MTSKTPRTTVKDYLETVRTETAYRTRRRQSLTQDSGQSSSTQNSASRMDKQSELSRSLRSSGMGTRGRVSLGGDKDQDVTPRHLIQNMLTVQDTAQPVTRRKPRVSDVIMRPPASSQTVRAAKRRSSISTLDLDNSTRRFTPRTNVLAFLEQAPEETPAVRKSSVTAEASHSVVHNVSNFTVNEVGVSLLEGSREAVADVSARGRRYRGKRGNLKITMPDVTPEVPQSSSQGGSRTSSRIIPQESSPAAPDVTPFTQPVRDGDEEEVAHASRHSLAASGLTTTVVDVSAQEEIAHASRHSLAASGLTTTVVDVSVQENERNQSGIRNIFSDVFGGREQSQVGNDNDLELESASRNIVTQPEAELGRSTSPMPTSTPDGVDSDERLDQSAAISMNRSKSALHLVASGSKSILSEKATAEQEDENDVSEDQSSLSSVRRSKRSLERSKDTLNVTASGGKRSKMPRATNAQDTLQHSPNRRSLRSTPQPSPNSRSLRQTPQPSSKSRSLRQTPQSSLSSRSLRSTPQPSPNSTSLRQPSLDTFFSAGKTREQTGVASKALTPTTEQQGLDTSVMSKASSLEFVIHHRGLDGRSPQILPADGEVPGDETFPEDDVVLEDARRKVPRTSTPRPPSHRSRVSTTPGVLGDANLSSAIPGSSGRRRNKSSQPQSVPSSLSGKSGQGRRLSQESEDTVLSQKRSRSSVVSRLSGHFENIVSAREIIGEGTDEPPLLRTDEPPLLQLVGDEQADQTVPEASVPQDLEMPDITQNVTDEDGDEDSGADDGYSPLKTPILPRKPPTPRTVPAQLPRRIRVSESVTPARAGKRKPATSTRRRTQTRQGLPSSVIKTTFNHFSKMRVSKDALQEVERVSDMFWKNMAEDLEAYAAHANRRTINESDVELLLKRQGFVTDTCSLNTLIAKYLPLELRQELIPIARSGNQVEPKL